MIFSELINKSKLNLRFFYYLYLKTFYLILKIVQGDIMSEIIGTNHPEIQALLKENSFRVIKKAKTLARLPKESEIGKNFDTFVEKKGIIVKESDATITKNSVIARNPVPLSNGSFNEWPMDIETFQKNYGCKL